MPHSQHAAAIAISMASTTTMLEQDTAVKTFVDTLDPNHYCQQPRFVAGGVDLPKSLQKVRHKRPRIDPRLNRFTGTRVIMKDATRSSTPDADATMLDAATTLAFLSQRSDSRSSDDTITTPSPTAFQASETTPTPSPTRTYAIKSTVPVGTWSDLSGLSTRENSSTDCDHTEDFLGLECDKLPSANNQTAHAAKGATSTVAVHPLWITTFQTRSRTETRALQEEAVKSNRRYVPPARQILQSIHCHSTPPLTPQVVEDLSVYPIIRIGDTVELKFKPITPFQYLCQGYELEPHGQVALGFATRTGPDCETRSLHFEILYHSFVDGTVCLRCQQEPVKCECNYASDLLEINRDWKAKKDPARRLGLRSYDDGWVGVALRIPRTRRPISDQEREMGCLASERPNTWNSKLKQVNPKDAKVVVIKVTEYSSSEYSTPEGPPQVISTAIAYARLIAKNGGQAHTSGSRNRKRKSPVLNLRDR